MKTVALRLLVEDWKQEEIFEFEIAVLGVQDRRIRFRNYSSVEAERGNGHEV